MDQFYAQTTYLPLPHKHSPNGSTTDCSHTHLLAAYCSFIDQEKMKGRVGLEYNANCSLQYVEATPEQQTVVLGYPTTMMKI